MPPIPCAHCGVNYMRHSLDPEAPKLCNNCQNTVQQKPKEKPPVTDIKVIIMMPSKLQAEIEEICINEGVDFSEYFLNLHAAHEEFRAMNKAKIQKMVDDKRVVGIDAENHVVDTNSCLDTDGLIVLPKPTKKKGK